MHKRELGIGLLVLASVGCGHPKVGGPSGTGASTSMMITASTGGMVSLEGTTLVVPAGALPADTVITITSTTDAPPTNFKSWNSPVFRFGPDGLVFLMPVDVTLTFSGSPASPSVRWSNTNGGFDNLAGSVEGDRITASVVHFSQGFVADTSLQNEPDGGVVPIDTTILDGPSTTPPPDSGQPAPDSGQPAPDGGPASDGGTPPPDGGTPTSDGGVISPPDGGTPTSDGGVISPPDGGTPTSDGGVISPPDGGTPPPDGGTPTSDGGTPTSDGGIISPPDGGAPTPDAGP